MDMEQIQKNYGVTPQDMEKIVAYLNQSKLDYAALQKDYDEKNWIKSALPHVPCASDAILKDAAKLNFDISCDNRIGGLISVLAASKPKSKFLEIGTGCGLGATWLLAGMDKDSSLISIETNKEWLNIAQSHLKDPRVKFINSDAADFIQTTTEKFDFIFADALPGKYYLVNETIALLNKGGFYVIDDCIHQEQWPKEVYFFHQMLADLLQARTDLTLITLDWAVGITIGVKL